jgi:catechol 2,3-dioxygenase-like lactoylglutathione lyase family enzyme
MPSAASDISTVIPVLRMYDLAATQRFYVDYLGCSLVSQTGEEDGPVYLIYALGEFRLHLSSFPGDGTPGSVVLIVTHALDALHAELHSKNYPFMNPGIDPAPGGGRQVVVIDPASNVIRFYEPG